MKITARLHDAIARFVRTFEATAVPILAAALLLAQSGHVTVTDLNKLALGLIVALVAGGSGFVLELFNVVAATPFWKAVVQAGQTFGAGLGTLVVSNLTIADGIAVAHFLVALAGSSVISGLIVYFRANSESKGTPKK